ncbi:MAG TPA: hypothetical protein VGV35_18135 [Bryobacteraceae bacterium]|nr:hypothetical protein [Bryobacteraceae bacterium]
MRPLRGELLLEAWERGSGETGLERALTMLAVACPDRKREELAALSIADRDLELLRLRRLTFGDALWGGLACPSCATRLEFEISVESMLNRLEALRPPGESKWSVGRLTLSMRPVSSSDLAAVVSAEDPRRRLLALCTSIDGTDAESALAVCEDSAVEHFNRLNQGAETRFTLPCPACGATEQVDLDIGCVLWAEVRHAALSILREVHELASAYGWTERAILEMTASRRACYLEMART